VNIHQPIKELVYFYSARLGDQRTPRIVDAQRVDTEDDAKHVLSFCEKMFELSMRLEYEKVIVCGRPAKTYDVEKVYSILSDLVSASGFDYLIED